MKLKRFNEFIAINESIHEFTVDELLVVIDGEIYQPYEFEVDLEWEHEPADPEVGIPSSYYYVENYKLYQVTKVSKLVDPEIKNELMDLLSPPSDEISAELADFGFKEEASEERITDIAFSGDWRQTWKDLTGDELMAFSKQFIQLYETNQLKTIVGNLTDALQTEVNTVESDYEDQSGDYYYSDDYDDDDRY